VLLRSNPVTAAEHYITMVVITQHGWTQDAAWLISPVVAAVTLTLGVLVVAPRFMTLRGGALG
jgi:ABC-2 type transport system permease protein